MISLPTVTLSLQDNFCFSVFTSNEFAMDRDVLELLINNNEKSAKAFVQILFDALKSEISDIRKENTELKKSLEFTQSQLEEENRIMEQHENKLQHLTRKEVDVESVSERVRSLEDYSRRNNIVVDCLVEDKEENSEKLQVNISKLLSEKLNLIPEIDVCHRLGIKDESTAKPRPVIIKFNKQEYKHSCLRLASKLIGTNIHLNEDVSKATHDIRKRKMAELLEKRKSGLIAYFSGINIITRQRRDHQTSSSNRRQSKPESNTGGNKRNFQEQSSSAENTKKNSAKAQYSDKLRQNTKKDKTKDNIKS